MLKRIKKRRLCVAFFYACFTHTVYAYTMNSDLFDLPPHQHIPLAGGELVYARDFLTPSVADEFLQNLIDDLTWEQRPVKVYNKTHLTPRLVAWCGDDGVDYTYSGDTTPRQFWPEDALAIKQKIEQAFNASFNGALFNYYRDGQDHMGWHSDNEKSLGEHPVIASLSLGAERVFKFRPHPNVVLPDDGNNATQPFDLTLHHGSVLIMRGDTQRHWQHALPKRTRISEPRLNITFRRVFL